MPESAPTQTIDLALAQLNPTVGDLVGNADLVIESALAACEAGAQVALFPELVLSGYPPEDLVLRGDFLDAARAQLERVAAKTAELVCLVGFPMRVSGGVANALAVLAGGEVVTTAQKQLLPNYGVFDEERYFKRGESSVVVLLDGNPVGLSICEDLWFDHPVADSLTAAGARLIVNASASPFHVGKARERESMLAERAAKFDVPIAYCNAVGGQDELVFDGASVVIDGHGATLARAAQFEEDLLLSRVALAAPPSRLPGGLPRIELPSGRSSKSRVATPCAPSEHETYCALTTGIRDYVEKNRFPGALIGVSGGIDSALVLALACDALGSDRVTAVTMPSPFNSPETRADGHELISRLGCESHELAIEPMMHAFEGALASLFASRDPDQTEENIQARIRGTLLMAISNKFGQVVLTTGNKSEMAVGYATLYGDMAGGFAALKDVPKQLVFRLSRWRNESLPSGSRAPIAAPIPQRIIDRPPSAELRPDQTDESSLGSYAVLDAIIEQYVEQDLGLDEIVRGGVDVEFATKIIGLIDRAEYKRRQAPPGVKITQRAFGRDRRMPITARRRYS